MRNTLLSTTAVLLSAGIASADGHATITWSGAATAGIARAGAVQAVVTGKTSVSGKLAITNAVGDAAITTALTAATYLTQVTAQQAAIASTIEGVVDNHGVAVTLTSTPTLAELRADIVEIYASIAGVPAGTPGGVLVAAEKLKLDKVVAILDAINGTAAVAEGKAGDFESYSKVNTTVTGSVAADNGMTITAAVSVDAGKGYTFGDDDTFGTTAAGSVSLDNITIATAMGTFLIDEGDVHQLVDDDDDKSGDILYTNTLGSMSVSAVFDVSKDTDLTAAKASGMTIAYADGLTAVLGLTTATVGTAAVAADVAWSAKVSMPVAGGSAYVAMDEEGGNVFGASTTLSGLGISFSSKLEALEEELSIDRSNTVGLTYVMGATTVGASWNSVEDGDQWGITAAYAADGLTIAASTDEGSDWSVSGSMTLGGGASAVAGVNYTEDAYLGLSFAF